MKDIVFYSKNRIDKFSPKLLEIMKTMPFAKEFAYYCIDNTPNNPTAKKDVMALFEIKEVPTMYVDGKKYVGPEAFEWLEDISIQLQNPQQHQQQMYQQQQQQQQPPPMYQQQQQQQQQPMQRRGPMNNNDFQQQQQQQPQQQPQQQSQQDGLQGFGGGGDSDYANPFDASSMTISGENFTAEQLERNGKGADTKKTAENFDNVMEQYTQQYKSELKPLGVPSQQDMRGGFAGMRM
jgi:hypothetical protein